MRKRQRKDPVVGIWIRAVLNKKPPKKEVIAKRHQHQTMSRNVKSFTVIRGLLYRETVENGGKGKQLVLSTRCKYAVLHSLHDDMCHPTRERTIALIRELCVIGQLVIRWKWLTMLAGVLGV